MSVIYCTKLMYCVVCRCSLVVSGKGEICYCSMRSSCAVYLCRDTVGHSCCSRAIDRDFTTSLYCKPESDASLPRSSIDAWNLRYGLDVICIAAYSLIGSYHWLILLIGLRSISACRNPASAIIKVRYLLDCRQKQFVLKMVIKLSFVCFSCNVLMSDLYVCIFCGSFFTSFWLQTKK